MDKRPLYLTIIALFLIAWGGIWLLVYTIQLMGHPTLKQWFAQSPRVMLLYIDTYLFLGACITCGFGVFRGYRWTRWLFVVYGFIHFFIIFMNRPLFLFVTAKTLIPIAIFLVISGVLFLPERRGIVKSNDMADKKSLMEDNQRLKDLKPLGICISVLPIFYLFLMTAAKASLPFDILQGNLERILFEPLPFLHVIVIGACSIPAAIFVYRRFENRYRNVVFLVIIGLVVAILYFFALCLITISFLSILFMISSPL